MSANQPPKYAWSYSSINLFKQCPQKYYRIRVKKDIVEPESEAMRYGTEVHKAAEDYIKDGTPVPPQFAFMQKSLDTLKALLAGAGLEHVKVQVGASKAGDPFTVVIASGVRPQARPATSLDHPRRAPVRGALARPTSRR